MKIHTLAVIDAHGREIGTVKIESWGPLPSHLKAPDGKLYERYGKVGDYRYVLIDPSCIEVTTDDQWYIY